MTICEVCGCRSSTRYHSRHDDGLLQHLCEKCYSVEEPHQANWPLPVKRTYRRERPLCREALVIMAREEQVSIQGLWVLVKNKSCYVSKNMRTQLHKMVQEGLV